MRNVTPLARATLPPPSPALFLGRDAVVVAFSPYSGTVLNISQWKHSVNPEPRQTASLAPEPNHNGRWWQQDQVLGSTTHFWDPFLQISFTSEVRKPQMKQSFYRALPKQPLLAFPPSERGLWMTKRFILSGVLCPHPSLPLLPDH